MARVCNVVCLTLISVFALTACTQEAAQVDYSRGPQAGTIWPAVVPGPYPVGYMLLHEYDRTRTFKPKYDYFGEATKGPIWRPLQISVWYPAEESADPQRMKSKEYYCARATETDFSAPTDERLKIVLQGLVNAWPIEFRVDPEGRDEMKRRLTEALEETVYAAKDAVPAEGPFPLIVHMPGYNGSPDDHAFLFEYLASLGYVVAAVPNMGMYDRRIDNEAASLDVQARDLEFLLAYMTNLDFVDGARIGTTGMSWGGMSNVLFAQRNSTVDAVLTLDGAITMPEELLLIEEIPGYSHRSFSSAYMQLLVAPEEAKFRPKDLRFYDSLEYCDAYQIQFHDVDHDAFSCGYLRLRNLKETDSSRVEYLNRFTRDTYYITRRFFDAYLKGDSGALVALTSYGNELVSAQDGAATVVRSDHKLKKRRPLSRKELVQIIKTEGAEEALKVYNDYCKIQPQNNLVVSSAIGPLYMNAFECGDMSEALAICELWETGLPRARGPLFSKARIYTSTGKTEKAILCYERILTLPGNDESTKIARERLQNLTGGPASSGAISIRWLGQASYLVTSTNGTTVIIDPINFKGYNFPQGTAADIVTVSHEHVDHNSVEAVAGSPAFFRGTDTKCLSVNDIDTTIADIRLYTVPAFHDPGHHRANAIFVFEFDGIRMAHLGDLGTVLSDEQIGTIGDIDILMIPVGGQFTIAAAQADTIVNQLNVSRIVLPMHYKTDAFDDLPYTAEPFLKGKENVRRIDGNALTIDLSAPKGSLEYVVMRY